MELNSVQAVQLLIRNPTNYGTLIGIPFASGIVGKGFSYLCSFSLQKEKCNYLSLCGNCQEKILSKPFYGLATQIFISIGLPDTTFDIDKFTKLSYTTSWSKDLFEKLIQWLRIDMEVCLPKLYFISGATLPCFWSFVSISS